METTTPIEQPQRVVKAWSHKTIGNVTLLAMLALVVLGWFPLKVSVSIAEAFALGAFAGFVVAAINWLRLGRRWKGLFHLLFSPLLYVILWVGIPLMLAVILSVLNTGSTDRAAETGQGITAEPAIVLYFIAAFFVIVYLYSMTKHDIGQIQTKGIVVKYGGSALPVGIAALSVLLMWGVTTVAGQVYVASLQNHVYCELLKPGMTEQEVDRALDEIGPHFQAKLDGLYPLPEGVAYSRNIYWRGSQHELTYFYSLWVGYDSNGKLVWKGREWMDISRPSFPSGLDTIQCPWTFQQSVMAR